MISNELKQNQQITKIEFIEEKLLEVEPRVYKQQNFKTQYNLLMIDFVTKIMEIATEYALYKNIDEYQHPI